MSYGLYYNWIQDICHKYFALNPGKIRKNNTKIDRSFMPPAPCCDSKILFSLLSAGKSDLSRSRTFQKPELCQAKNARNDGIDNKLALKRNCFPPFSNIEDAQKIFQGETNGKDLLYSIKRRAVDRSKVVISVSMGNTSPQPFKNGKNESGDYEISGTVGPSVQERTTLSDLIAQCISESNVDSSTDKNSSEEKNSDERKKNCKPNTGIARQVTKQVIRNQLKDGTANNEVRYCPKKSLPSSPSKKKKESIPSSASKSTKANAHTSLKNKAKPVESSNQNQIRKRSVQISPRKVAKTAVPKTERKITNTKNTISQRKVGKPKNPSSSPQKTKQVVQSLTGKVCKGNSTTKETLKVVPNSPSKISKRSVPSSPRQVGHISVQNQSAKNSGKRGDMLPDFQKDRPRQVHLDIIQIADNSNQLNKQRSTLSSEKTSDDPKKNKGVEENSGVSIEDMFPSEDEDYDPKEHNSTSDSSEALEEAMNRITNRLLQSSEEPENSETMNNVCTSSNNKHDDSFNNMMDNIGRVYDKAPSDLSTVNLDVVDSSNRPVSTSEVIGESNVQSERLYVPNVTRANSILSQLLNEDELSPSETDNPISEIVCNESPPDSSPSPVPKVSKEPKKKRTKSSNGNSNLRRSTRVTKGKASTKTNAKSSNCTPKSDSKMKTKRKRGIIHPNDAQGFVNMVKENPKKIALPNFHCFLPLQENKHTTAEMDLSMRNSNDNIRNQRFGNATHQELQEARNLLDFQRGVTDSVIRSPDSTSISTPGQLLPARTASVSLLHTSGGQLISKNFSNTSQRQQLWNTETGMSQNTEGMVGHLQQNSTGNQVHQGGNFQNGPIATSSPNYEARNDSATPIYENADSQIARSSLMTSAEGSTTDTNSRMSMENLLLQQQDVWRQSRESTSQTLLQEGRNWNFPLTTSNISTMPTGNIASGQTFQVTPSQQPNANMTDGEVAKTFAIPDNNAVQGTMHGYNGSQHVQHTTPTIDNSSQIQQTTINHVQETIPVNRTSNIVPRQRENLQPDLQPGTNIQLPSVRYSENIPQMMMPRSPQVIIQPGHLIIPVKPNSSFSGLSSSSSSQDQSITMTDSFHQNNQLPGSSQQTRNLSRPMFNNPNGQPNAINQAMQPVQSSSYSLPQPSVTLNQLNQRMGFIPSNANNADDRCNSYNSIPQHVGDINSSRPQMNQPFTFSRPMTRQSTGDENITHGQFSSNLSNSHTLEGIKPNNGNRGQSSNFNNSHSQNFNGTSVSNATSIYSSGNVNSSQSHQLDGTTGQNMHNTFVPNEDNLTSRHYSTNFNSTQMYDSSIGSKVKPRQLQVEEAVSSTYSGFSNKHSNMYPGQQGPNYISRPTIVDESGNTRYSNLTNNQSQLYDATTGSNLNNRQLPIEDHLSPRYSNSTNKDTHIYEGTSEQNINNRLHHTEEPVTQRYTDVNNTQSHIYEGQSVPNFNSRQQQLEETGISRFSNFRNNQSHLYEGASVQNFNNGHHQLQESLTPRYNNVSNNQSHMHEGTPLQNVNTRQQQLDNNVTPRYCNLTNTPQQMYQGAPAPNVDSRQHLFEETVAPRYSNVTNTAQQMYEGESAPIVNSRQQPTDESVTPRYSNLTNTAKQFLEENPGQNTNTNQQQLEDSVSPIYTNVSQSQHHMYEGASSQTLNGMQLQRDSNVTSRYTSSNQTNTHNADFEAASRTNLNHTKYHVDDNSGTFSTQPFPAQAANCQLQQHVATPETMSSSSISSSYMPGYGAQTGIKSDAGRSSLSVTTGSVTSNDISRKRQLQSDEDSSVPKTIHPSLSGIPPIMPLSKRYRTNDNTTNVKSASESDICGTSLRNTSLNSQLFPPALDGQNDSINYSMNSSEYIEEFDRTTGKAAKEKSVPDLIKKDNMQEEFKIQPIHRNQELSKANTAAQSQSNYRCYI